MAKKGKSKVKSPMSDKIVMLVGSIVMVLLFVGSVILTGKYIKEYQDSKSYKSTTAYIVGDISINKITEEDKYGNVKSVKKYYDYKYVFEVNGQEYGGEKNNSEEYYGESFEVLYDENDPAKFVIAEEATFPLLLLFISIGLGVLAGAGIYKTITD